MPVESIVYRGMSMSDKKRIILVGASGVIGQAVNTALVQQHEVVTVGHSSGDYQMDMSDERSIIACFEKIGHFDALIVTAGQVRFKPLAQMQLSDYQFSLQHKLLGQVGLVLHGLPYINDNGSFTLTTGILNRVPIIQATASSMVNNAIEGFVKSAAVDMPRGVRINVVSPTLLQESVSKSGHLFPGFKPVPASDVALGFVRSVMGAQTGQVYCID